MTVPRVVYAAAILFTWCGHVLAAENTTYQNNQKYPAEFAAFVQYLEPVIQQLPDSHCRDDLMQFQLGLSNASLWAVQMLDASSKLPLGLVTAHTYQLGNYDQCVSVDLKRAPETNIAGRYCLTSVEFTPLPDKYPRFYDKNARHRLDLLYDPYLSVWEKFLVPGVAQRVQKNIFRSGVCVPTSCTPGDVEQLVGTLYNSLVSRYGIRVNVTVSDNVCSNKQAAVYSPAANKLLWFLFAFAACVVLVTIWDVATLTQKNKVSGALKVLTESFSMQKNYAKVTDCEQPQELEVLHSMKALTMALIIFGHRLYLTFGGPVINRQRLEEGLQSAWDMYILNGPLFVDTFLVITGFLNSHYLIAAFKKNPRLPVWMVYLKRWLRIAPAYTVTIFFYAYLLEHIGSGPLWKERVVREANRCQKSWWANLLFINNYVQVDNICMLQSWYVAVDMHYILIAPLVIRLLVQRPSRGWVLFMSLVVATLAIPFHQIYTGRLMGIIRTDVNLLEDQTKDRFYTEFYIKTHNRALPYLIGIGAASIHYRMKDTNFQFKPLPLIAMTATAVALGLTAYLGAWTIQIPGKPYSPLENALVGTLQRLFWALAMSYTIITCSLNQYGAYQGVFIRKALVPLSRLSYTMFLIHGVVQMSTNGTMRTSEYVTIPKMVWLSTADIASTAFFALLFHCFFEAPVRGLVKVFIFKQYDKEIVPDKNRVTEQECKEQKITNILKVETRRSCNSVRKRLGGH